MAVVSDSQEVREIPGIPLNQYLNVDEKLVLARLFKGRLVAKVKRKQGQDLKAAVEMIADGPDISESVANELRYAVEDICEDTLHVRGVVLPRHAYLLQVVKAGIMLNAAKLVGLASLYCNTVGAALRYSPKIAEDDGAAIKSGMDTAVSLEDWVRIIEFIGDVAAAKLLVKRETSDSPWTLHPGLTWDLNAIDVYVIKALEGGVRHGELDRASIKTHTIIEKVNEGLALDFDHAKGKPTRPFAEAVEELLEHLRERVTRNLDARGIEKVLDRIAVQTEDRLADFLRGDRGGNRCIRAVPWGCSEVAATDFYDPSYQEDLMLRPTRRRHKHVD